MAMNTVFQNVVNYFATPECEKLFDSEIRGTTKPFQNDDLPPGKYNARLVELGFGTTRNHYPCIRMWWEIIEDEVYAGSHLTSLLVYAKGPAIRELLRTYQTLSGTHLTGHAADIPAAFEALIGTEAVISRIADLNYTRNQVDSLMAASRAEAA